MSETPAATPRPTSFPGQVSFHSRVTSVALFALQRIATLVIVVLLVATVVFFMLRFVPGGPFEALASEKELPETFRERFEDRYNLNDPLFTQYTTYILGLLQFDFGESMTVEGLSVAHLVAEKFPRSAQIGFLSVIISIIIGIPVGMISAYNRNRWPDKASMGFAILGVSVPNFVLASILILVFVFQLRWFPAFGIAPPGAGPWEIFSHLLLPALALTGFSLAYVTRLLRSSMLDVLNQDYIRTARAKGLSTRTVLFKHALRNAVLPVLTYMGPLVAATFTGSFVIETIFSFPGLGEHFVRSITNRDYTVVLGVTIFYSAFLIAMNMLIDILYGVVDPRIEV